VAHEHIVLCESRRLERARGDQRPWGHGGGKRGRFTGKFLQSAHHGEQRRPQFHLVAHLRVKLPQERLLHDHHIATRAQSRGRIRRLGHEVAKKGKLALHGADVHEAREVLCGGKGHHRGKTHLARPVRIERGDRLRRRFAEGRPARDDKIRPEQPLRLVVDRALEIRTKRADCDKCGDAQHH
jgi:hypothetical protein